MDATPNDESNEKRALLMVYPQLRLRPGRDYTLRHGHPWVFSGAFQTQVAVEYTNENGAAK